MPNHQKWCNTILCTLIYQFAAVLKHTALPYWMIKVPIMQIWVKKRIPRSVTTTMSNEYDLMLDNDIDSSFRPLCRRTMAITKFQVMLNDLLLKHKASLLQYDEIIDLFSSYISSPNFNRLDKFKSRKSLLQSTQKSLNTGCL